MSLFNRGDKKGKNRGTKELESGESRHSFGDKKESSEENGLWDDRKISSHNSSLYPFFHLGKKALEFRQTGDNRHWRVVFVAHRGLGQPNTWDQRGLERPKPGLSCHPDEGFLVIPTWLNGQTLVRNSGTWKRRVPKSKVSESSTWLGGGKAYLGVEIYPRRDKLHPGTRNKKEDLLLGVTLPFKGIFALKRFGHKA